VRASVIRQFAKPWVIEEVPRPEPGPGQVLIRVTASAFCGTDVHVHHGRLPVQAPVVAGHQPVGVIESTGPGVTDLRVGERVGVTWFQKGCGRCEWCRSRRIVYCEQVHTWMDTGGGNAEFVVAWAEGCTLLPDGLADEVAAPMFCAGYTVLSALRMADPKPGERVAVIGFGGLGHLAVQFAKGLGHETVVVTSSAAKVQDALALGADDAVLSGDHIGDTLRHAGKADIVLACTNSAIDVGRVMSGLRPGGRVVNTGYVEGPICVDVTDLTFSQRRLIGATMDDRADLAGAIDLCASGKVTPRVETFPLDAHNEVLAAAEAGTLRYCGVLLPWA